MGTRSIEEVAEVRNGDKWFQMYTWRDRSLGQGTGRSLESRRLHGGVAHRRHRSAGPARTRCASGNDAPPEDRPRHDSSTVRSILRGPGDFLRNEPITFANVVGLSDEDGSSAITLSEHMARQFDPALSWDDVEWLRSVWDGPIVLKGIQTVADAKQAVAAGVDGIGLSNHGGRQLDDAPVPIDLVEPVRDEIADGAAIICDGGVRRGSDIVKAIALGADAVSMGRPYLYALGAAGERGVDQLLEFMREGTGAHDGAARACERSARSIVRWYDDATAELRHSADAAPPVR